MRSQIYLPSKLRIFCDGSSIRGMQKIIKAPTPFLRMLWVGFVVSMTILLIMSTIVVFLAYLNYDSAWHTKTLIDHKTEFPAISLCSHNPFSMAANELWKKNATLTPKQFQQKLLNISSVAAKKKEEFMSTFSLLDSIENYYANLDYNSTLNLSHERDMINFCMILNVGFQIVAENCSLESTSAFQLSRFSHRKYLNCWTIQRKYNQSSEDTTNLIILVKLNPLSSFKELDNTFVMDVMTQGEGLKLVVHEPFSYPDIDRNGINVQPGKMNEITYRPVKWKRLSSPIKPCKDTQGSIHDLENNYNYTLTQCLDAVIQEELINTCSCMVPQYPRRRIPTKHLSYCTDLKHGDKFNSIFQCYSQVMLRVKALKENAMKSTCLLRCSYMTYETILSVTKWNPTMEKMIRLTNVYRAMNNYLDDVNDRENQKEYLRVLNPQRNPDGKTKGKMFTEDSFTYVSLNRQNDDTTEKKEKLILDINILLSRIGGLCSLSIGLTTAFFIELIEFIYLSFRVEKQRRNTMVAMTGDEQLNTTSRTVAGDKEGVAALNNNCDTDVDPKLIDHNSYALDMVVAKVPTARGLCAALPGYSLVDANVSVPFLRHKRNDSETSDEEHNNMMDAVNKVSKLTHPVSNSATDDGVTINKHVARAALHSERNPVSNVSPWQRASQETENSHLTVDPVSSV